MIRDCILLKSLSSLSSPPSEASSVVSSSQTQRMVNIKLSLRVLCFFCCCECYSSVVCIRSCLSNRCFVVNLLHGRRDLKVKGDSPEELLVSLGLFNTILGVCIYICVHLSIWFSETRDVGGRDPSFFLD